MIATYKIIARDVMVEFNDQGYTVCRTCGFEQTAQPSDVALAGNALDVARDAAEWHTTECGL